MRRTTEALSRIVVRLDAIRLARDTVTLVLDKGFSSFGQTRWSW